MLYCTRGLTCEFVCFRLLKTWTQSGVDATLRAGKLSALSVP